MIRILEESEKSRVRSLYEEIYDSAEGFLECYHEDRANASTFYVDEEDGKIVALLQMTPKDFNFSTKELKVAYIHGMATMPGYENQGRVEEMLKKVLNDIHKEKFGFAYLLSNGNDNYEKFGFTDFFQIYEATFKDENSDETLFLRPSKPMEEDEIADYYNACLDKNKRVYLKRDARYFMNVIEMLRDHGGNLEKLVDTAGNMMAFCFVKKIDGVVYVSDISSKYGYERQLLNLVCQKYEVPEVKIDIDEKCKFFDAPWMDKSTYQKKVVAMARLVDMFEMAEITKVDPERVLLANIKDDIIEANNIKIELRSNENGYGELVETDKPTERDISIGTIGLLIFDKENTIGCSVENADSVWLLDEIG